MNINVLTYNMSWATQINKSLGSEADLVKECQKSYKQGGLQCHKNAIKKIGLPVILTREPGGTKSAEKIREFIVNGFIIIKPNVKPSIHKEIDNLLRFITENEFLMGNNIMARIPLLWEILRCSKIDGALTSLLGKNYYITHHREVHRNEPV